ncbi:hypothetical protein LXL04_012233 [Taraxacum kok-saghyz]
MTRPVPDRRSFRVYCQMAQFFLKHFAFKTLECDIDYKDLTPHVSGRRSHPPHPFPSSAYIHIFAPYCRQPSLATSTIGLQPWRYSDPCPHVRTLVNCALCAMPPPPPLSQPLHHSATPPPTPLSQPLHHSATPRPPLSQPPWRFYLIKIFGPVLGVLHTFWIQMSSPIISRRILIFKLDCTKHLKVWISYAKFEASAIGEEEHEEEQEQEDEQQQKKLCIQRAMAAASKIDNLDFASAIAFDKNMSVFRVIKEKDCDD